MRNNLPSSVSSFPKYAISLIQKLKLISRLSVSEKCCAKSAEYAHIFFGQIYSWPLEWSIISSQSKSQQDLRYAFCRRRINGFNRITKSVNFPFFCSSFRHKRYSETSRYSLRIRLDACKSFPIGYSLNGSVRPKSFAVSSASA